MAWGVQLPVKPLDAAYDPYVNQIAVVENEQGEPVAYVITHAERPASSEGSRAGGPSTTSSRRSSPSTCPAARSDWLYIALVLTSARPRARLRPVPPRPHRA